MKIPVGVSKRHVHLTEETFVSLFGYNKLEVRNYLNQPGEYASNQTVDIKWNDKIIEHLRIIGPFRKYNQVELSGSDAKILEVNPPRRKSGEVKESLPIILIGPKGEVNLEEGLILAERHVHIPYELSLELGISDDETLEIKKNNGETFMANAKVQNPAFLEMHIDTDEEVEYDLHQGEEVEVSKL